MFGKRYKNAILEIINRAKEYTPAIGKYCDHAILADSEIIVRLTNGTLSMPVEAAIKQDSLPYSLKEDWIQSIAGTFEEKKVLVS
jgi:hypothetical protein